MKTAIIYDYIPEVGGGGERMLYELVTHFPSGEIDLYVGFVVSSAYSRELLQNLRLHLGKKHLHLGPKVSFLKIITFRICNFLLPMFYQTYNLSKYDQVISYTAFLAHSIKPPLTQRHIVIMNTPARFLWNLSHAESLLKRITSKFLITDLMRFFMRLFDLSAFLHRPRLFAICKPVQQRILSFYNQQAEVIYPPSFDERLVSTDYIDSTIAQQFGGEYYTHVSRVESYKNLDLVLDYIEHVNPSFRMVIMGNGPYLATLEKRVRKFTKTSGSKGSFTAATELVTYTRYNNIFFTGFIREQAKFAILANSHASFSLNDEDFGITKVESLAVGTPLIAFAAGGALDIMPADLLIEHNTNDLAIYTNGISFMNATAENLRDAIALHEKTSYSKDAIRQSATPFSIRNFHRKLDEIINERVR